MLYFMKLPSLRFLVLHTYEELLMRNRALRYKCTLCRILGFRYKLWKSGVNLIKIPQIPKFYQQHKLLLDKWARPAKPCQVCFWPATRETLPTPVLADEGSSACCYNVANWRCLLSLKRSQGLRIWISQHKVIV